MILFKKILNFSKFYEPQISFLEKIVIGTQYFSFGIGLIGLLTTKFIKKKRYSKLVKLILALLWGICSIINGIFTFLLKEK